MSAESRAAHRALFISIVNDAALFPPAALEMRSALQGHVRHRDGDYADLVGPFLVGVPALEEFTDALDDGAPAPPRIGLIARPGTPTEEVGAALGRLRRRTDTQVVSLDTAWTPGWRELDLDGLPVQLEVGREGQIDALDDIASAGSLVDVRAKFRTGPTPDWEWPDEQELASFVVEAGRRDLPFVLTGGLHHVIRGEYRVGSATEEMHGLLNVLLAVHAVAGGADEQHVRELLAIRDAAALAPVVAGWSVTDVAAVRSAFVGYGCCDVTDPIGELAALALLDTDDV